LAPRHFSPQNNERCCLGIVGDGNFGAHGLLWIAKAHDETAPIGVGMVPTCVPGVVGTPVRNTVAPVPIAPLVAPAAPVPTASTVIAHQLNERCRPKLNPRRVAPNRRRLRWGREGQTDGQCKDRRAYLCLRKENLRAIVA
jgi:hypothetical protein